MNINIRSYKHPNIDHIFEIKDINMHEIEIDGIKVSKSDCSGLVRMSNHCSSKKDNTANDIAEFILHKILELKNKK